jgi:hypothetical protein
MDVKLWGEYGRIRKRLVEVEARLRHNTYSRLSVYNASEGPRRLSE